MALELGIKGRAEVVCSAENTAAALGSGALPVFSTPSMIALMEKAAQLSVQPYLDEGQGTVGTELNVAHLAPTPMGMTLVAESELVELDRRILTFRVEVFAGEELVGKGTHKRCIIYNDRFMEKAQAKVK